MRRRYFIRPIVGVRPDQDSAVVYFYVLSLGVFDCGEVSGSVIGTTDELIALALKGGSSRVYVSFGDSNSPR